MDSYSVFILREARIGSSTITAGTVAAPEDPEPCPWSDFNLADTLLALIAEG